MRVQFIARFKRGREYCLVEVDEQEKYELEKIESYTPYWIIRDMSNKKIGSVESLLIFKESIESGQLDLMIAARAK